MTSPKKILLTLLASAGLIGSGTGIGWWLALHHSTPPAEQTTASTANTAVSGEQRKVLYWYDPMQPQQHFDQPGPSPFMDMALIPKYADSETTETPASNELRIDPAVSQSLAMRLAEVSRIPLSQTISASALIGFNERDIAIAQTRSGGFVERVWPLAPGDVVKAGQPLAEILVPDWATAQQEFLLLRQAGENELLPAARERLRLLGMPAAMIRQLESSGKIQNHYLVSAPLAGVVQNLAVRNGMTLTQGQTVATINGLATVWLEVAVPEAQTAALQVGNHALVRLTAFPGREFHGRVFDILPTLNPASRSARLRIELANPKLELRPGQSAQVTLHTAAVQSAVAVPSAAVIRSGKRNLVMLADGAGRFTPQAVELGQEIGNQTVITAGLRAGQQVVVSGQFLLDSEASLNGMDIQPIKTETMPTMSMPEHAGHSMPPAADDAHQHHMADEQ